MSDQESPCSSSSASTITAPLNLNIIWNKNKTRTIHRPTAPNPLDLELEEVEEASGVPGSGSGSKRKRQRDAVLQPAQNQRDLAKDSVPAPLAWSLENFPNFLERVDLTLNALLLKDPILNDLADGQHHSRESCEVQLAFESGQGVRIRLKREDGSILPILIKKNETVLGLKKRIATETERELKCGSVLSKQVNINWRHVWRQNLLLRMGTEDEVDLKLEDDTAKLKDVGLVNNSEIRFVKKIREKKRQMVKRNKKRKWTETEGVF